MQSFEQNKIKVGVIRGGSNNNYKKSLEEGGKIISYLKEKLPNKTLALDILIDKSGVWHLNGLPIKPLDLLHKVDLIWDTTIPACSQELSQTHIPIYKISHFNTVLGSSKDILREYMSTVNIQVPNSFLISSYQKDIDGELDYFVVRKAKEVHQKFGAPWLVKAFTNDEDMGIHVAKTFGELIDSIRDGVLHNKSILVEELIEGRKIGLHTLNNFRNQEFYHLLPYEILEQKGSFICVYDSKFSKEEKENIFEKVKHLFKNLGLKNYLHSEFTLHPRRGLFLNSINLIPDLSAESSLFLSCKELGILEHNLVENIINNTLREK